MIVNDDYDSFNNEFYINITTKIVESKCIINITNQNYKGDFGIKNSIGETLGFRSVVISESYNISHEIVDITKIYTVLVNVQIIVEVTLMECNHLQFIHLIQILFLQDIKLMNVRIHHKFIIQLIEQILIVLEFG